MSETRVILGALALNVCFIAVGYSLLRPALRSTGFGSRMSYIPLALLLGAGCCGVTLELLVLVGLRANLPTFGVVVVTLIGLGLAVNARLDPRVSERLTLRPPRQLAHKVSATEGVLATACCCLVLILAALVLLGAFRTAPWLDDSWTFWIPKGIYLGDLGLDPRMFTPNGHYIALTHRSYPVFWSITAELALRFTGHTDLRAVTGELAVLTVAFVGAVARVLAGRVRPAVLWFGLALLLLSPEIGHQTQGGGADLVLGVYLCLFVISAYGWIAERNRAALVLAAVFGGVALATKVEALPEFAICAGIACFMAWRVDRRAWRPLLLSVLAAAASSVPWFVWAQLRAGTEPRADYGSSLNLTHVGASSRIGPAAKALATQALNPDHWLLIVPLTLLLSLLVAAKERKLAWLAPAAMVVLIFAFFVWIYWFDTRPLTASLNTTGYRVFAPTALLAAAALPLLADRLLTAIPAWDLGLAGIEVAAVLAVVVSVAAAPVSRGAQAPVPVSPRLSSAQVSGPVLHRWKFPASVPAGWKRADGLTLSRAGSRYTPSPAGGAANQPTGSRCLPVVTGQGAFDYQLIGPDIRLAPGSYVVSVKAGIQRGGLEVGVLDSARDKWLETANYTSTATGSRRALLGTGIHVQSPTRARIILANMRPNGGASKWAICSVAVHMS